MIVSLINSFWISGVRRGKQCRRLIMLIFAGWVPHYSFPSASLPHTRVAGLFQPRNVLEDRLRHRCRVSLQKSELMSFLFLRHGS
jgi:hypothetical protein